MAQFLRPDGNVTLTGMTGGFADIDESTASDADFAYGADGGNNIFEVSLSNPGATPASGAVTVRYRLAEIAGGVLGDGSGVANPITISVLQGTTQIASTTASPGGAWTTYSWSPDLSAVTDWTDLRLRFVDTNHGGPGSSRRAMGVSWAELEAADGASATIASGDGSATAVATGSAEGATVSQTLLWTGTPSPDGVVVTAKLDGATSARMVVSTSSDLSSPVYSTSGTPDATFGLVRLEITGLSADTEYHYGVEVDGVLDSQRGKFRTFPTENSQASFRLAFGSCLSGQDESRMVSLDAINGLATRPALFIHMGDFIYQDVVDDGVVGEVDWQDQWDICFNSVQRHKFLREMPTAYTWDDHDFGADDSAGLDSGGSELSWRSDAVTAFRRRVPDRFASAGATDPVYQSFTIGRVRFLVSDLRSYRHPATNTDNSSKSMMGATQKQWWKDEVTAAAAAGQAVVWISSVPFHGATTASADFWAGYSTERTELADHIKSAGMSGKVIVLCGDMHSLAYATNIDYATGGGGVVNVFQAAPLRGSSSQRGGPYDAIYPPTINTAVQQYGLIDFTESGGVLTADFTGYSTEDGIISTQRLSTSVELISLSSGEASGSASATATATGAGEAIGGVSFPTGWQRRCAITVPAASVSGSGALTNFPLLLTEDNLPSEMFDSDGTYPAQADGGDIRFTSDEAGTTLLPCEIVSFATDPDPVNGTAVIFVRTDVSALADTTIYAWYSTTGSESQPAATDALGSRAVWDTDKVISVNGGQTESAHGYTFVDHADPEGEGTSGAVSTTGGPFGAGHITAPRKRVSEALVSQFTNAAYTVWVQGGGGGGALVSRYDLVNGHMLFARATEVISFLDDNGTAHDGGAIATTTWHRVDAVVNGTSYNLYINGVLDTSTTITANDYWPDIPVRIGCRGSNPSDVEDISFGTDRNIGFTAVRVHTKITADWIATEYNNQNAPASFTTTGSPTTPGGGVTAGDGSAAGTATTSATGASTAAAAGLVTAQGTAGATGLGIASGTASSAATSLATGAGSAVFTGSGTASGATTSSGIAAATAATSGAASASASADGTSDAGTLADTTGSAAALATASGVTTVTAAAAGTATGTASASAASEAGTTTSGAGSASASSTVSGVATVTATATGAAGGAATASAASEFGTTVSGAGSATGLAIASGAIVSTAAASGTASGTTSASAASEAGTTASGAGSASGVASGLGSSAATRAVSGTASASTTSSAVSIVTAAAAGSASAQGTGDAISGSGTLASGAGSAAAISTASGAGAPTSEGSGQAAATSSVSAGAGAVSTVVGTASGTSSVSGTLTAVVAGSGSAAANASAGASSAVGTVSSGAGSASATSTASATGARVMGAAGSATATSTSSAAGRSYATGVGLAPGFGVAVGEGSSIAEAAGSASGDSTGFGTGQDLDWNSPVDRVVTVGAQNRTYTIAGQQRTITIGEYGSRVVVIDAAARVAA